MLDAADPWLLPLAVLLPLVGGLAAFLLPRAAAVSIVVALANLLTTAAIAVRVSADGPLLHRVGGWGAPLGIDLYADGLAAALLLVAGLVCAPISLYAARYFRSAIAAHYWPLWLLLITALNALLLSRDLFNLYVTLELLGLSAVALTALEGSREALPAALRYLFASLVASLLYLLGVALVYHLQGHVAIVPGGALSGPLADTALVLMTVGLLLKGALFPFHFWLPPAHSSAAAPVSAALSALVIKAAFYIVLRLWLDVFGAAAAPLYAPISWLGAAAVLWGSVQAILAVRIKLVIAYSTVAQFGYLFLALPLVADSLDAIVLLAVAHALAKAAMFLAAGNLVSGGRGDRLDDLARDMPALPVSSAALGIAGITIMGLPPSGGFSAKWLLLEDAIARQRWDIAAVLLIGGLLAAVYVFRLVEHAFLGRERHDGGVSALAPVRELAALSLALLALVLGLVSLPWLGLVAVADAVAVGAAGP